MLLITLTMDLCLLVNIRALKLKQPSVISLFTPELSCPVTKHQTYFSEKYLLLPISSKV